MKFTKKTAASVCLAALMVACFCGCGNKSAITLDTYSSPLPIHTEDQLAFIEGDDLYAVSVYADGEREKSRPEALELKWSDSKNTGDYVVEISENSDFSSPEAYETKKTSVSVYNLKIATEYYWRVKADGIYSETGTFTTSDKGPRNLYIDGITNVRDIGGYTTSFGKRMRQGLIFRGARLNKSDVNDDGYKTAPTTFVPEITEKGKDVFKNQLGIKTEIDLRLLDRNGYPADKPAESAVSGVDYIRIPMNGNASIITNAAEIKQFMEVLADESCYPVYFHCNIGTDRTGMLAYLLEGLCGANEDDMMKDYLFSNFGNIGEAKEVSNSKNKFVTLLGENGDYSGETTVKRVESYFESIGVTAQTYNAVRDILLGN